MNNRLQEPIGIEVVFDGWAKPSAQRYIYELMNLPCPVETPLYVPPGTRRDAPYGPAGKGCSYPILLRGTGMKPNWRFTPEQSAEEVLAALEVDFAEIGN